MKSTITHKLTIEEAKELILYALAKRGVIARETVSSCDFVSGDLGLEGDGASPFHFKVSVEADLVAPSSGNRKTRKTTLVEKTAEATDSDQSALDL